VATTALATLTAVGKDSVDSSLLLPLLLELLLSFSGTELLEEDPQELPKNSDLFRLKS